MRWRVEARGRFGLRGPLARAASRAVAGPIVLAVCILGGVVAGGMATARAAVSARTPRADTGPAIGPPPALPPLPASFDGVVLSTYLGVSDDPFLNSAVLGDEEFSRAVHAWVDYWIGPADRWFPGFLERLAYRGAKVDTALARAGLPPSLRYLPLIESGYDPTVTSRASAVGMWQLMAGTAGDLGLEVNSVVDERRDPDRATAAALTFIQDLNDDFDSWFVTLAAYNSGGARVRSILRRHAAGEPVTDSLFWALRAHFPRETREFLPKLYGAMWVASRPEAYGYSRPEVEQEDVDVVHVSDRTTLDVIALAAGVAYVDVVRLNPKFLRGVTPRDEVVSVRLPEGRGRTFNRIFPRIRPEDRVRFVEHQVAAGETLSTIALRYGVAVDELRDENPRIRSEGLGAGDRLTVPLAPPAEPKEGP